MSKPTLSGADALDVLRAAENRARQIEGDHLNCVLTLLSTALCLASMNAGIPRAAVLAGVGGAYDQAAKIAPNTAAKVGS